MELDISKFLAHGQFSGSFKFGYLPPQDICLIPLCNIAGEADVEGTFEIYDDDSIEVNLKVGYGLEGKCSYCLSEAKKRIEFEAEFLFVTEHNDDDYYYDGKKIDLKAAVDEAILLNQPSVLLCRDDCKGIVVK